MTVSQTALIVTSNEQNLTFWNEKGTKKMIELYSNIKEKRIEVRVDGVPQLRKLEENNDLIPFYKKHGNNPFQKGAGFVVGLVMKNKINYLLTVTVECRVKTWIFPRKRDIYSVSVSGVESLTEASVHY